MIRLLFKNLSLMRDLIGAHGAGETPDTIPNSEAKPSSGDDTPSGESSTVPNYMRGLVNAGPLIFLKTYVKSVDI